MRRILWYIIWNLCDLACCFWSCDVIPNVLCGLIVAFDWACAFVEPADKFFIYDLPQFLG